MPAEGRRVGGMINITAVIDRRYGGTALRSAPYEHFLLIRTPSSRGTFPPGLAARCGSSLLRLFLFLRRLDLERARRPDPLQRRRTANARPPHHHCRVRLAHPPGPL